MDFKKFKAVAEDEHSYTIEHPGGKKLFLEKAKLSKAAHSAIQSLYKGGESFDYGGTKAALTPSPKDKAASSAASDYFKEKDAYAEYAPDLTKEDILDLAQPVRDKNGKVVPTIDHEDPRAVAHREKLKAQVSQFPSPPADQRTAAINPPSDLLPNAPTASLAGGGDSFDYGDTGMALHPSAKSPVVAQGFDYGGTGMAGAPAVGRSSPMQKTEAAVMQNPAAPAPQAQASPAPQPRAQDRAPAVVDPLVQEKTDMQLLLERQIKEQQAALDAGHAAGQEIAGIQQQGANALGKLPSFNDIVASYNAKDQQLAKDYAEAKIDPDHFMHNMSTGSKILTGIGMVLSGMGAATTGQPSYAMQVINDAIKRDVEAQAANRGAKMNLWEMNRKAMGNDAAATLATQNQIQAGVLAKLQAAQTRASLPQEKLRVQQAIDQLQQQIIQNNVQRALISGQGGSGGPTGQAGGKATLSDANPYLAAAAIVKDPKEREKVIGELKGRENIALNGQKMLELWDKANAEMQGIGASGKNLVGFHSGNLMALQQTMMPNFDKIDNTVRKDTMDQTFTDILPSWSDHLEKGRAEKKREGFLNWLQSGLQTPTAEANAIFPDRYKRTAKPDVITPAAPPPNPLEGKTATNAQGQKIIMKNGKWVPYAR